MATALARRRVTLDDFTWEAIKSPDILGLTAKTDVQIDHEFDRGDQGIEPARVTVTMKDGGVFVEQCDLPTGTPSRPLSFADIERKFRNLLEHAGQPIPADNADRLVETIARLEELDDARYLAGLAG